ncbi:hypothetical protein PR048_005586 [Dryococelus australis]|uniref:Uncharacterized protein n=1 Tax=Dryococelus australis TaxID=614101 RepID=A0ABQ9I9T3_9NEOP|nr:hypothetical protein PR048_005586 [Dryococelus australis]
MRNYYWRRQAFSVSKHRSRPEITAEKATQRQQLGSLYTLGEVHCYGNYGSAVAERLACSPPTKDYLIQSPAGNLPDFCMMGIMPLVGGFFSGISRFLGPFIPATPYSLKSPSSALKTSLLRAAQISSLTLILLTQMQDGVTVPLMLWERAFRLIGDGVLRNVPYWPSCRLAGYQALIGEQSGVATCYCPVTPFCWRVDVVRGIRGCSASVFLSTLCFERSRGRRSVRLLAHHQGESGSTPSRSTPVFWQVGIVPDDAAGRRVFSGISLFLCPCISEQLHFFIDSQYRVAKGRPSVSILILRFVAMSQLRKASAHAYTVCGADGPAVRVPGVWPLERHGKGAEAGEVAAMLMSDLDRHLLPCWEAADRQEATSRTYRCPAHIRAHAGFYHTSAQASHGDLPDKHVYATVEDSSDDAKQAHMAACIDASMEDLRRNEKVRETGSHRENPPTSGIVRHYSHVRKSRSDHVRNRPRFAMWEANSLATSPPRPL